MLAEAGLRAWLEPVDFLQPELVPHDVLPLVVRPGSAGHDAWGFRNREVPEHADVLAIGDSQTYGVSAPRAGSWPAQLERRLGRSVYNLALGSYGPLDYLYLLRTYGPRLSPGDVVIALYLGNDLMDAARTGPPAPRDLPVDGRPLGVFRTWLARHSLLYQATKYALPFATERARSALARGDAGADLVELRDGALRTGFVPEARLSALDPELAAVQLGLAQTREVIEALPGACRALGARCLVALIPTKESVFADAAARLLTGSARARVLAVVAAEERARRVLHAQLAARDLRVVDVLPALRRASAGSAPLYPSNYDSHPVAAGYAVIAEEIARHLSGTSARARASVPPSSSPASIRRRVTKGRPE